MTPRMAFGCKIAAALALLLNSMVLAQETDVSLTVNPAEARAMATRALHMGRPDLAAQIAGQILLQTPNDAETRLVLAAAKAQLGQVTAASHEARTVFRQSSSEDLRFQAAYLMATTLSAQNRLADAKFWLRRADGVSQSASDTSALKRAYSGIDRRMPLRWSIQISGGPSDNVNGGSLHDTFWAWGLPIPIAGALPGYSANAQLKASWRLAETDKSQLMLIGALSTRQVQLSDRARVIDPAAKASDYESLGLDLGLNYRWKASNQQSYGLEAQLGHRWLAAGRSSDSQKLKFSADRALSGDRFLAFDLIAVTSQNSYSTFRRSTSFASSVALTMPLGNGSMTGSLGYDAVLSDAAGIAWRGPKVAVELSQVALQGNVQLSLFGDLQMKDFWKTASSPDLTSAIGVSARFDKLSLMGFAPTLSVTSSRSVSDIVVRDTAETSISLGLASKF